MSFSLNPIHLITRAHLSWFNDGRRDARFLDRWRAVPLSRLEGGGWHEDHHVVRLGHDDTGERFRRCADALLRYQFYPRDVMRHTSDFGLAGRRMAVGDRIVQRIPVITLFGLPGVDVMTMNEIVSVIDEPRRVGFSYVTTQAHSEEGIWSAQVEWRADGELWLSVESRSRPAAREPRLIHPLMRYMQKRSHRRGIETFRASSAG